jgi:hypothetical protein
MKDNISIMYINYDHVCTFINYKLPLDRGTHTPYLLGTSANLNHVTTTNVEHNKKLINRKGFIYKVMLPPTGEEKIQSLQISLISGWVAVVKRSERFAKKSLQICQISTAPPPRGKLIQCMRG